MTDRTISTVAAILFCGLVLVLLLILYYPSSSLENYGVDSYELTPESVAMKSGNAYEYIEPLQPKTNNVAIVAKILEDMGASFLAFLAVICVTFGLFCIVCACSCVA